MIYGLDVQLAGRFDITYARKLMIETSVWDMVYQVGHKGSSVYYLVEIGPWLIWFMIGGCVVLVWELVEIIKKLMRVVECLEQIDDLMPEIPVSAYTMERIMNKKPKRIRHGK